MTTQLALGAQLECRLGSGASSQVWQLHQGERTFALKVAKAGHTATLAKEAKHLTLAEAPSLPTLFDAGYTLEELTHEQEAVAIGSPYLLMSLVPGVPLSSMNELAQAQQAREQLATSIAIDIGQALSALHSLGVAHGDIKPENIMVECSGDHARCRLLDLGLSQGAHDEQLSGGTPRYLPPPDLAETGNACQRDLWALGLTLLETADPSARLKATPSSSAHAQETPLYRVIQALLSSNAEARPSARWIGRVLGGGAFCRETAQAELKSSYLSMRKRELLRSANGAPYQVRLGARVGSWLESSAGLLARISTLNSGDRRSTETVTLESLDHKQQRVWLLELIGAAFLDFPELPQSSDEILIERLWQFTCTQPCRAASYGALTEGRHAELPLPKNSQDLALELGASAPREALLDEAERQALESTVTDRMLVSLGNAFKRRHELKRAARILSLSPSALGQVEHGGVLVRTGELDKATELLTHALERRDLDLQSEARARSYLSRLALMAGDVEQAKQVLSNAPASVVIDEANASVELTEGRLDEARKTLARALGQPQSSEQRGRIEALMAYLEQQLGQSEAALRRYQSAAQQAARAYALLDEATYLVGVASTAANQGELKLALDSAERSGLLFRHLNQPDAAARAALSRAAVYVQTGAQQEALAAAHETLKLARRSNDSRCQAFAHLALCDVSSAVNAEEHLERASSLLGEPRPEDQLRLSSRRLKLDLKVELAELDRLAASDVSTDVRLEWWGARAETALRTKQYDQPVILRELCSLASAQAGVDTQGAPLAYGAQLAADCGDGETARVLAQAASHAYRKLLAGAPTELRSAIERLPWAKLIRAPSESEVAPGQLADIETLVHGLGERERLKPLLDRVLDALVLWTGVERGLLLLNAPGGKLVPRAARNIARSDLSGEQLKLSTTLAERAVSSGECVVAVDASFELPDVHESVHSLRLRSVLAVPLMAKGSTLGVVYLDDRMRRGAFGPRELAWVRLVATIAAVAIADARAQLLLRRAVRKTERAERRLEQALATREAELAVAESELGRQQNRRGTRHKYTEIIGESESLRTLLRLVDRVASADVPVLISGESGSGKELVARAIHQHGSRKEHPFVTENCSAIPESLLESTLFGHEKGAFTGAVRQRAGLFEVADGGTLFLDEIADMSLGMQTKLLRVLESGEVRRVGGERTNIVDVRIIAASHKNLDELTASGVFRQDLYYRLNVITLRVPALRERPSDILILARHFLRKHGTPRNGSAEPRQEPTFTRDAERLLTAFSWPGNIRQLENEVRRAIVLSDGVIDASDLSATLRDETPALAEDGLNLRGRIDHLETQLVTQALAETDGNQTKAAQLLGVSRFGLQKMIKRLGLSASARSVGH